MTDRPDDLGPGERTSDAQKPSGDSRSADVNPLPPPVFPGGTRTPGRLRGSAQEHAPLGLPEEAVISPDDPLPAREAETTEVTSQAIAASELVQDEGVVVGMGGVAPSFGPSELELEGDLGSAAVILERVAANLREHGRGALRADAEMGHFEGALRSYLAGYFSRRP